MHTLFVCLNKCICTEQTNKCYTDPVKKRKMDAQQIIRTSKNSYYIQPQLPKHAKGVKCPASLLAMPELECCQLPGIVHRSLKHEVMVVDEWHDNGPQDLVTVSLCIQNSNN